MLDEMLDELLRSMGNGLPTSSTEREREKRIARRKKKSSSWITKAVEHWSELIYEGDIGCDWDEADVRCWRCGHLRSCQRCHIVPRSLGGSDEIDNLIPLCAECHDEMPNVSDGIEVWKWIAHDHGELHDTYWTLRALSISGLSEDQLKKFDRQKLFEAFQSSSPHFGQLHGRSRYSPSTLAWVLRKACES